MVTPGRICHLCTPVVLPPPPLSYVVLWNKENRAKDGRPTSAIVFFAIAAIAAIAVIRYIKFLVSGL